MLAGVGWVWDCVLEWGCNLARPMGLDKTQRDARSTTLLPKLAHAVLPHLPHTYLTDTSTRSLTISSTSLPTYPSSVYLVASTWHQEGWSVV